jgi:hypothetical protein
LLPLPLPSVDRASFVLERRLYLFEHRLLIELEKFVLCINYLFFFFAREIVFLCKASLLHESLLFFGVHPLRLYFSFQLFDKLPVKHPTPDCLYLDDVPQVFFA